MAAESDCMSETTIWTALGAIATVLGAVGTWALVWLVSRQWLVQHQQAKADALERLHRDLISVDVQHALRVIFAASPKDFLETKDLRLLDAAERVLNLYDLIGHRVMAQTLPPVETLRTEWPVILRVAQQLLPLIRLQEVKRGAKYKTGFLHLVELVRANQEIQQELKKLQASPTTSKAVER
jgi:hypothetical protein